MNNYKTTILGSLFAVFFLFAPATVAVAADDPIYTGIFNNRAVSGYDAVAYFKAGKPVKGDAKFTTEYMGAEWYFSSQENLDEFVAEPAKYAPQYGGHCAWAVANGYTASGDPNQWKIVDGKLYLNYNAEVKADWEVDIPGFIMKADVNYPKLVDLEG